MRSNSFDQAFARSARAQRSTKPTLHSRSSRDRIPSSSGYILAAGATAAALFFTLWWMLHSGGDEVSWIPAGLAACVVMLVAVGAREVVMRRAWARYILEQKRREQLKNIANQTISGSSSNSSGRKSRTLETYTAALRTLQKQCAEADAPGKLPEAHLEAYLLCKEYLDGLDETLRAAAVSSETRVALRAGQERVRSLARHHTLAWARGASRLLTQQAQQRFRLSDKIETAQRALEVIDSARKLYPEEADLRESKAAVHEFMASAKVSHWVEMAERAAFKGYYVRAIDRYRDALFYLSREEMRDETRAETAERIKREIEMLRARLKTSTMDSSPTVHARK
ncbi:MAG TPA: hypothetical protein VF779_18475 [Pyrinomonadaceae bacterium]